MAFAERIKNHFSENIQTNILIADSMSEDIASAGEKLANVILRGNRILLCGNGRCAAQANHFTTQLLHRFEMERPALPAIDLTNMAPTSAIANDIGFQYIFSKQVMALGSEGDALICISKGGNDENLIEAIEVAHEKNIEIISLTGKDGGKIRELCGAKDTELCVPSENTARIYESHSLILHCLSDVIDKCLFGV